jgi:hypothetical protein
LLEELYSGVRLKIGRIFVKQGYRFCPTSGIKNDREIVDNGRW